MTNSDRNIRFVVGTFLIFCVLFLWTKPALALIAIYPINTAIIKWDPFYAIYFALKDFAVRSHVFPKTMVSKLFRFKVLRGILHYCGVKLRNLCIHLKVKA